MEPTTGKLFVGGLSPETTGRSLREHFREYGEVLQAWSSRDNATGISRRFGFVVFSDPSVLETVISRKHRIHGKTVTVAKDNRSMRVGQIDEPNTIFVGEVPRTLSRDGLRQYFNNYGAVNQVRWLKDKNTGHPRNYAFITFDSQDAVAAVLGRSSHCLDGTQVRVKQAHQRTYQQRDGHRHSEGPDDPRFGNNANGTMIRQFQVHHSSQESPQIGFASNNAAWPTGYGGYNGSSYGYGPIGYYGYGLGGYGGAVYGQHGPFGPYWNGCHVAGPHYPWACSSNYGFDPRYGVWSGLGSINSNVIAGYGNQCYDYRDFSRTGYMGGDHGAVNGHSGQWVMYTSTPGTVVRVVEDQRGTGAVYMNSGGYSCANGNSYYRRDTS